MARSKDALAERERLRAERARARKARLTHGARAEQLRAEAKQLPREREAALREAARAGKAPDTAKLDARERELRDQAEREAGMAKAASQAVRDAERELVELHHREFGEFCDHAESLSAKAAAKLAALESAYRAAYEAAEEARREWGRVVRDRNSVVLGRLSPADRARGEHRRLAISPPPGSPLRDPGEVFASPPIRPPEIEPIQGSES